MPNEAVSCSRVFVNYITVTKQKHFVLIYTRNLLIDRDTMTLY